MADLAEWMVRSLHLLVGYAPGNGKKVTLDWYVDCEIYKKHQYIGWDVNRKAGFLSASAVAILKARNKRWIQSDENSMASPNNRITRDYGRSRLTLL